MIYIDRKKVPKPKSLKGKALKETTANTTLAQANQFDQLKFAVYRSKDVKSALIKLFQGKCAYCESKMLHVYPGDVEHFRPKGKITGAKPSETPGYYWLAADWENLLLSCRNCNQILTHDLFGVPGGVKGGKMNQFPLDNNGPHAQTHVDHPKLIKEEEKIRLLINPCKEDPEEYFEYDETTAVIRPGSLDGKKQRMAKKTIEVLVLQRMPLVLSREKLLIEVLAQIQRVMEATGNVSREMGGDPHLLVLHDKILKRELSRLKKFTNADQEYAGMARQIVNKFIASFSPPQP